MDAPEQNSNTEAMRLREAFFHYAACLAVFIILVAIAVNVSFNMGFILFISYFAFGIYLNRKVLRSIIEWHPTYNTLDNVASAKLGMVVFWPFRYLSLFFQLGISKVL